MASRLEHDPPLSLEQAVEKSPANRGCKICPSLILISHCINYLVYPHVQQLGYLSTSFIHPYICPFIHSFIHPFVPLFVCSDPSIIAGDGSSGIEATCSPNPDGDTTPTPSGTSNSTCSLLVHNNTLYCKKYVNPFMSYMCYPYIHFLSMCPFLDPIDLTQDDDLQKALALSLQDMQHQNGGISLEEQELSRCVL